MVQNIYVNLNLYWKNPNFRFNIHVYATFILSLLLPCILLAGEIVNLAVLPFLNEDLPSITGVEFANLIRKELIQTYTNGRVLDLPTMRALVKKTKTELTATVDPEKLTRYATVFNVKFLLTGRIRRINQPKNLVIIYVAGYKSNPFQRTFTVEGKYEFNQDVTETIIDLVNKISTAANINLSLRNRPLKPGGLAKQIITQDGMPMVLIPEGDFLMGSSEEDGDADEHPAHRVYVNTFYIDKYEVTSEQFAGFINVLKKESDANGNRLFELDANGQNGIRKPTSWWEPIPGMALHPAVYVTWYGANEYAQWVGKRLATEAEWERAARGPQEFKFPWGNEWGDGKCNHGSVKMPWYDESDGYLRTAPVGSYEDGTSQYGVYDLAGNIMEWTADWYDPEFYKTSLGTDPTGPGLGKEKVVRGGSWFHRKMYCNATRRSCNGPQYFDSVLGFRCVKPVLTDKRVTRKK